MAYDDSSAIAIVATVAELAKSTFVSFDENDRRRSRRRNAVVHGILEATGGNLVASESVTSIHSARKRWKQH